VSHHFESYLAAWPLVRDVIPSNVKPAGKLKRSWFGPSYKNPEKCPKNFPGISLKISGFTSKNFIKTPKNPIILKKKTG